MDRRRKSDVGDSGGGRWRGAAGVFLWSRRNQISDQLDLSDQIGEWTERCAGQRH